MHFDHRHWRILESEERRKMHPVEPLIKEIDKIVANKNVAFDIGAGTGYYTIPLSRIFKRVYAVEMNEKMVEVLIRRLEEEKVKNVGIILTDKPPEIDFGVDFILFANVLHEMDEELRLDYLRWAKMSNSICVVDWKKDARFGPPPHVRIDEEDMAKLMEEIGFDVQHLDIYEQQYVLFGT
ncbi:class I SAM-dependent methyltransferase [Archaeoglobales archaeon]|nr:MAG: class I SAM-dependent methyltransferase [Archaeoglobales archaeon]